MQRGDWTLARETALRAAQLQPYDVNILLRLSACYGQERDFINAHLYFGRACALLSVSERATHMAKLERLQEQAEDAKNNVYKEDPLDKFPLEIVINIFQLGLQDDPLLALKEVGSISVGEARSITTVRNCGESGLSMTSTYVAEIGRQCETNGWSVPKVLSTP
mgnify:CR=1 FL=1